MVDAKTKVYLDVSALGRPFDDQRQLRVQLETNAVGLILASVARGEMDLARSVVHWEEISANPDRRVRDQLIATLTTLGHFLDDQNGEISKTVEALVQLGVHKADALHVAIAARHSYDFVTCDDRL